MKTDIDSREKIEKMVNLFYEKVRVDDKIGHFFNTVMAVDWDKHLPKMYNFWQSAILGDTAYSGNIIKSHAHIHEKYPMTKADFERWVQLFEDTLNENFEGPNTENARQRAMSMSVVMQIKILH